MANTASNGTLATGARPTCQVMPTRRRSELDASGGAAQQELRVPVGTRLCDVERWMIFSTLRKCGGNKTRAAALLGVSLKTLYNRLNAYRVQGLAMDYEAQSHEQADQEDGFDVAFEGEKRGGTDEARGEPTQEGV